ncbi:MAG: hypothetical protein ABI623_01420 [bacterium]
MDSGFTIQELAALQEVIKEHLTELRTEIVETEDSAMKEILRRKEENLSGVLAKIERSRITTLN